jgi:lysophospholipase L1-like esterase
MKIEKNTTETLPEEIRVRDTGAQPPGVHPFRRKLLLGLVSLAMAVGVAEWFCRALTRGRTPDFLSSCDRPAVFYDVPEERQPLSGVRDEDAFRIAVIGDSFTVGVGVQERDTYAAQLEHMLNTHAGLRPVKVRQFAHAGTSTFQQSLFLTRARRWKPDVVILGICLNDTEDMLQHKKLRRWREEMYPPPPGPALAAVLRHSAFLTLVHRGLGDRAATRGFLRYYQRIYDPDYSGWTMFRVAIKKFKLTCEAEQIRLVPVILPLMSDPFDRGRYRFEFAHEAIGALLREQELPYLDTLERFRGKNPVRMTAVPVIDPHPSEIAHRIIAEAILDHLLAIGCLPEDYRPVERPGGEALRKRWQRISRLMTPAESAGEHEDPGIVE